MKRGLVMSENGLLEAIGLYPTSEICDAMLGRGAMDCGFSPIAPGMKAVGYARVLTVSQGDLYGAYRGASEVGKGEILVIAQPGGQEYACADDALVAYLAKRGAAGLVVDGAIRGIKASLEVGLPVFARGVALEVATRTGADDAGPCRATSAVVGGVLVNDGDIIVADGDGVVVISKKIAHRVLARCKEGKTPSLSGDGGCRS